MKEIKGVVILIKSCMIYIKIHNYPEKIYCVLHNSFCLYTSSLFCFCLIFHFARLKNLTAYGVLFEISKRSGRRHLDVLLGLFKV